MTRYVFNAQRLREAAAALGDRTDYAIAKRVGLSQSTVGRILNRGQEPGLATLATFSREYGASADDLILEVTDDPEPEGAAA